MYRGYYLNLDRSERRRDALTSHLRDVGALDRYERFPAVDGREAIAGVDTRLAPGELGLWLTHERLFQHIGAGGAHVHVIEDDAWFAPRAVGLFPRMLEGADRQFPDWDLLYTDVVVPPEPGIFRLLESKIRLHASTGSISIVDLADIDFAATSSFFVNRRSIRKYAELVSGGWSSGAPIDLFLRQAARRRAIRAYVVVPFPTTVSDESRASDIQATSLGRQVLNVFRRAFFIDADREAILAEMESLTRRTDVPALEAIFLAAERFARSEQWAAF